MKYLKIIIVLVFVSGCASTSVTKKQTSTPVLKQQSYPLPFSEGQVWRGSYDCAQGATSLDLRIQAVSARAFRTELGKAYDVSAIFDFDFKSRSASGAFHLSGKFYPEKNVAIFKPKEWINRPNGYLTVGMDGLISSNGKAYFGNVTASGCKGFQVNLIE